MPNIHILSLGSLDDVIGLKSLSIIPEASHILLLCADFVGFAVLNGDDTYPRISNWRLHETTILRPYRYTQSSGPQNSGLVHVSYRQNLLVVAANHPRRARRTL